MNGFRVLGTDDSVNTCDHCGRINLKSTVAIDIDGAIVHYGSDCAARALQTTTRTFTAATRNADAAKAAAAKAALDAHNTAVWAAVDTDAAYIAAVAARTAYYANGGTFIGAKPYNAAINAARDAAIARMGIAD